jgi:hypothetical protein
MKCSKVFQTIYKFDGASFLKKLALYTIATCEPHAEGNRLHDRTWPDNTDATARAKAKGKGQGA